VARVYDFFMARCFLTLLSERHRVMFQRERAYDFARALNAYGDTVISPLVLTARSEALIPILLTPFCVI